MFVIYQNEIVVLSLGYKELVEGDVVTSSLLFVHDQSSGFVIMNDIFKIALILANSLLVWLI